MFIFMLELIIGMQDIIVGQFGVHLNNVFLFKTFLFCNLVPELKIYVLSSLFFFGKMEFIMCFFFLFK